MSKVFVIPDVHLKPWMFDKAEEQLNTVDYGETWIYITRHLTGL